MTAEAIKDLLRRAAEDPDVLKTEQDNIDRLLAGVVRIEKKHLYGIESGSARKRQSDILEFLERELMPQRS